MKTLVYTFLSIALGLIPSLNAQDARQLVAEAIDATGGKDNFYNLGSVRYDYKYDAADGSLNLASTDTYVFDGEKSYAEFSRHSILGPNGEKVVEGFNGNDAWVTVNGEMKTDEQSLGLARFLRKTNYYWFTMFFKMLDEGVNHELLESQTMNGTTYDRVKVTFGNQVGDAQDTYILYINKETKLIDQFLFTVMGMGITEPLLMKYEWETIDGIKIGANRKYAPANWNGEVTKEAWTTTTWTNIEFGVEVDDALFEAPKK